MANILCRFSHKWTLPSPMKPWHFTDSGVWVYCERCGRAGLNPGPLYGVASKSDQPWAELEPELEEIYRESEQLKLERYVSSRH